MLDLKPPDMPRKQWNIFFTAVAMRDGLADRVCQLINNRLGHHIAQSDAMRRNALTFNQRVFDVCTRRAVNRVQEKEKAKNGDGNTNVEKHQTALHHGHALYLHISDAMSATILKSLKKNDRARAAKAAFMTELKNMCTRHDADCAKPDAPTFSAKTLADVTDAFAAARPGLQEEVLRNVDEIMRERAGI